jgi:uncharacterized membrane protein
VKLTREATIAAIVIAAEATLAGLIYRFGKLGALPMHFGLSGQVDRWGDRTEAAIFAGVTALASGALYVLLPILARPRAASAVDQRSVPIARLVILVVSILLSLLATAMGFGLLNNRSPLPVLTAILSVIMLAMGAYLGRVEPNPFVGVRTYWSLRSRLAWDKSNRLFGRIAFWIGVAGLLSFPLAPQPLGFQLLMGALILGAVAAIFESWRVWRDDPDRRTA